MRITLIASLFFLGLGVALAAHLPSTGELFTAKSEAEVAAPSHLGIYQGHDASIEKRPYIVAVYFKGKFTCAGTIVGSSWVLLSGDCVDKETPEATAVYAGSTNVTLGRHYAVEKFVTHPKYKPRILHFDFALIKIKGAFKWSDKVKQIGLPKTEIEVGSETVVSGWGVKEFNAPTPLLQEGTMKAISLKECAAIYDNFGLKFIKSMGCVYNKGSTTLCQGDWSDPITQNNLIYCMFVGIAKEGFCTTKAFPAICANVVPVVPWIEKVIKKDV